MWFDNDPHRPLEEKVKKAVQRYREKFGRVPNICYVNPDLLSGDEIRLKSVRVVASSRILPNHFLVSFAEEEK